MTTVSLDLYWDKLVEYYYDTVHWDDETGNNGPFSSIAVWLQSEYGASYSRVSSRIYFEKPENKSWFIMRWS
jgi:hypothetical protein